ncbi:uncharacterized protein [Nicotiana sylvestris]|uniref:uncharacterized protein n=1 Tax=Nicotiana sylvestris TaxID=4096 RepID=UPI00388C4E53
MDKVQLIRQRLLVAQSRQKSYADKRRRDLVFTIGDKVFLRVFRMKGVIRFGERGKLSPRFIGAYEILDRMIEAPTIPLVEKMSYEEAPMAIVDRQVRKLRSKEIVFVKVLWRNHTVDEATWEVEKDMQAKYPHLFQSRGCV